MREYLTKCPHCNTVFKLNQGHLDAADGAVRCGSCLEVFNARESLQKQVTPEPSPHSASNTPSATKKTAMVHDPLTEDDDVHWTQALSNDIDKIYQYIATELELDDDPELSKNLENDQWGRDLLAELDEELTPAPPSTQQASPEGEPSPKDAAPKPKFIKSTPSGSGKGHQQSKPKQAQPEKPATRHVDPAPQSAPTPETPQSVGSQLPTFGGDISDHALNLPNAQTNSPKSVEPSEASPHRPKTAAQPSKNDASDDWSSALMGELKQAVEQSSAHDSTKSQQTKTSSKTSPDARKGRLPIFKGAQKIAPPTQSDPTPSTDDGPIVPSFSDPVGLEAEPEAPAEGQAPLNDSWSNSLLTELENQSQSIADNIKQALREQDSNSLVPDEEVSLDDLALIPLREHKDKDGSNKKRSHAKQSTKEPQKKPTKKSGPQTTAAPIQNPSALGEVDLAPHTQAGTQTQIPPAIPDATPPQTDSTTQTDNTTHTNVAASLNALATEFEPEFPSRRRHFPKIPWLALFFSLLFSAGLAGQVAFFEFEHLVEDQRLRPWYARFCDIAKCQLPAQEDFAAIESTQLFIREHPTENNALVVDINIRNQAPFAQPFPAIELRFEDLNGKLVAKRTFTPDEYKKAKLKDVALMPSKRKIHLTLEIVDPGKSAKSYELKFYQLPTSPA